MTRRPTPSLEQFKAFARDVAPAARAVLLARAYATTERARVDAYVRPIFDRYTFALDPRWADKGLTVTVRGPEDLYLCDLEDPTVAAFYAACDDAHWAHGFTGPAGHCPALHAEHLATLTENALIDLSTDLFGVAACDVYGDTRARFLELLIGAALKTD